MASNSPCWEASNFSLEASNLRLPMEFCLGSNSLFFYLFCNCQISSISVLFLFFKLLCCLVISVVLLQLIRLFQHLENVYFIFQMFSGIFGENRSFRWILSHEGHIPKWKVSKIEVGKLNVSKNRGCIFYCF